MDLYREEILDHYRNPRGKKRIADADVVVTKTNASCGDEITLYLKQDRTGEIDQIGFTGEGCAISQAATSMLMEVIMDMTISQVRALTLDDVYEMLGGPVNPARVKCAQLGLVAVHKAVAKIIPND